MLQLMKADIKTIREDLVCMKELEKDIQKKKGEILAKDVDIPIDEEPAQELEPIVIIFNNTFCCHPGLSGS